MAADNRLIDHDAARFGRVVAVFANAPITPRGFAQSLPVHRFPTTQTHVSCHPRYYFRRTAIGSDRQGRCCLIATPTKAGPDQRAAADGLPPVEVPQGTTGAGDSAEGCDIGMRPAWDRESVLAHAEDRAVTAPRLPASSPRIYSARAFWIDFDSQ